MGTWYKFDEERTEMIKYQMTIYSDKEVEAHLKEKDVLYQKAEEKAAAAKLAGEWKAARDAADAEEAEAAAEVAAQKARKEAAANEVAAKKAEAHAHRFDYLYKKKDHDKKNVEDKQKEDDKNKAPA